MAIEEAIEGQARSAAMSLMQQGGHLVLQVSGSLATKLVSAAGWSVQAPASKVAAKAKEKIHSGQMSEKRLQKLHDADLHEIKLDDESLKEVGRSLRKSGVDYAVEKSDDGYYLHFQGKDTDHVQHAVNRAFESVGLGFDPEPLRKETVEKPLHKETAKKKEKGVKSPTRKGKKEFMTELSKRTESKMKASKTAEQITRTKGKTR